MSLSECCRHCGAVGGHQAWCQSWVFELGQKQLPLSNPTASQTRQHAPAGLVPSQELGAYSDSIFPAKQQATQGGGFKRTEAEIEAERGERRELIVIQWYGAEPHNATAELLKVLVKPDQSLVVRDVRPLGKVSELFPGEQAADALGRKPDGIMIWLK